jgi:hypothetical protein
MPPLASTVVDQEAIDLLRQWITTDLAVNPTFAAWQVAWFGSTNASEASPQADPDGDGASNYLEYLTGTNPTDATSLWSFDVHRQAEQLQISFTHLANRSFQVQATSSPADPDSWKPLDVPGNEPFFPAQDLPTLLSDDLSAVQARFYRVLIQTP